jgi:hypothetical protein
MMDPVKVALTQAYSLNLTSPMDEVFRKKDPKLSHPVHRAAPRRVQYDADRNLILSLPNLNRLSAFQSRTSCINTTNKAARGMAAGRLLAAAANQPPIRAGWLEYAYNPYLDINSTQKQFVESQVLPLLYGLWCYWPRRKTPTPAQLESLGGVLRMGVFFKCVLHDALIELRTGQTNRKTSSTLKCEKMGYGVGKSAYQAADYSRTWLPMEQDLKALFQRVDSEALDPVRDQYYDSAPRRAFKKVI